MIIATLVKVVPDLENLTIDPATNAMRRTGTELYLNPFDARAALVAPLMGRPGDSKVIVCMGPLDARSCVLEAMAMGSDRGLLVSDRALEGSDTLVTAKVLARALRPVAPDVVLAGRWSTDSSTGQVPAQLAENLGLSMVNGARSIERKDGGILEVVGETEEGWDRYELSTPCVITVGEKIVKMRHPTPEALKEAEGKPIEVRNITDLGLNPGEVGLAGSPTIVRALRNDEPLRTHRVFGAGPASVRVREAAATIRELLARPRLRPPAPRAPASNPSDAGEVLVFASGPEGGLDMDSLPLISEVLRLPEPFYPSVVGFGPLLEGDRAHLARAGAVRVFWGSGGIGWRTPEELVPLVSGILRKRPTAAGALFLGTTWTRELAGRVSSRMGLGLTGDVVSLSGDASGGLVLGKPSFGGGFIAEVVSRQRPSLATIRAGPFVASELDRNATQFESVPVTLSEVKTRLRRVGSGLEHDPRFGDMESARVVVAIGMGIGGPDRIPEILETIRPLGAALAASRKVVDSGWVPPQLQVGLTGKSLAPDLYIAVGVSGKANHWVGVKRARVTVGINTNASEPLFSRVDVGIVGEWSEILGPLVGALSA
ncbi:MAG TPA: FAD-binding protein [Thermoplasmata archaeon]|nr:FAD-binding protein [Thermoplasmata archaeon]